MFSNSRPGILLPTESHSPHESTGGSHPTVLAMCTGALPVPVRKLFVKLYLFTYLFICLFIYLGVYLAMIKNKKPLKKKQTAQYNR